jgi:hypothetical protein
VPASRPLPLERVPSGLHLFLSHIFLLSEAGPSGSSLRLSAAGSMLMILAASGLAAVSLLLSWSLQLLLLLLMWNCAVTVSLLLLLPAAALQRRLSYILLFGCALAFSSAPGCAVILMWLATEKRYRCSSDARTTRSKQVPLLTVHHRVPTAP